MTFRAWLSRWQPCGLAVSAACGSHNPKAQTPKAPPVQAPTAPTAQAPPADPIGVLIATSQQHSRPASVSSGSDISIGRGASSTRRWTSCSSRPMGPHRARLRAQFDRLVDRINAQEMTSLAQGDGFSALKDEPAAIDELLNRHVSQAAGRRGDRRRRSRRISSPPRTTSRSRRTRASTPTSSSSRGVCASTSRRA